MGYKGVIGKTNFTLGEISPRILGRFDADKPIFRNGAQILENFLINQGGSVQFRPGTQFIAEVKDSTNKVRLERFQYSISQEYVLELGNLYMRFYANLGRLESPPGTPVEISTIFAQASLFDLQMANKADVMYICHPLYHPQKLIRTSSTTFTIGDVPFVRGPFRDTNITATTITPSSATGATTLTASSAIFLAGHVGSLWRVKGGVVKITTFTNTTTVSGTVQAEPSGAAGDLGTTSATADWAEGAFSDVRGWPAALTFHEQRLVYAGNTAEPQKMYASCTTAYDNFDKGIGKDSDAWAYEIASNVVNSIRWLNSDTALKIGTSGGTVTATSQGTAGITQTAPPNITFDTDDGVMALSSLKVGGYVFYMQANKFNLRQLTFDLIVNKDKTNDLNLLADHVIRDGGGAVWMARQQSPNNRLWIGRADGQIAVLTRNPEQQVTGWCRIVGGESDFTATCNGLAGGFETGTVLPIDGGDDQVWVVCERLIGGVFKRFVEVFTDELFQNYWEPVRVDSSLSLDNPIAITGISQTDPMTVTAPAHGLSENDLVKLNGIIGMEFLNDQQFQARNVTTNTFDLYQAT